MSQSSTNFESKKRTLSSYDSFLRLFETRISLKAVQAIKKARVSWYIVLEIPCIFKQDSRDMFYSKTH